MERMISTNSNALRFLMTEDIYILKKETFSAPEPKIETVLTEREPETIPVAPKDETPAPTSFNYLGENNRYFLIIVDDATHADLNTVHREMLMKIMTAKGMEMRDLAILNLNRYPGASFLQLKDFFSCNRVVLFGIDPQRLSIKAVPSNAPEKVDGVSILATFSLAEMAVDTDKKRQFWTVMKDF